MQLYGERFYHDFDDAHAHQMALQSSSADRIPIKNVVVVVVVVIVVVVVVIVIVVVVVVAVTQSTTDGLH